MAKKIYNNYELAMFIEVNKLNNSKLAKVLGVTPAAVTFFLEGVLPPEQYLKLKRSDFDSSMLTENCITKNKEQINNQSAQIDKSNFKNENNSNQVPLAQAQLKPIIPSELYERLDCDINEYIHDNLNNIRCSETIKQFAPFSYFFEVMGDAMSPYFLPSDMLALKIQPHPFMVENGRVYVIDTRIGVIMRMLYRNGENFLAKAFNPRYTELPIQSSDVYNIYKVVGLIRRNI